MREKSFWEPRLAGYSDPEQGRKNFNRALFKHALDHEVRANSYKTSTTYPAWNLVSDFNGMGPTTVNGTSYFSGIGRGLVNDIEINPTNPDSWTIAIAGGGVWQTTDKGVTWADLDPNHYLPIQDAWDVEINPSDPNEIFVALTGFSGTIIGISTYSLGVYKTTNNGQYWFHCDTIGNVRSDSLRESWAVRRVKVDRFDNDKIYAFGALKVSGLVKDQFWYSESKGDTFTRVDLFPFIDNSYKNRLKVTGDEIYEDMHLAQTVSHKFVYLSGQNLLRSSDEGQTWTDITPNLAYLNDSTKSCYGYYPMEMRLASNDSILYVVYNVQRVPVDTFTPSGDTLYEFDGKRADIYLEYSTDWGDTWNEISNIHSSKLSSSGFGGGEFGFEISPQSNSSNYQLNTLIIGYVDYAVSNDGGQTFSRVTDCYTSTYPNSKWIHPDNRGLRLLPGSGGNIGILSANDGGVAYSSDSGNTWNIRNEGLHSEPLGGIGLWEENSDTLMAGTIHIGGILKLGKKCYTTSQGDYGDAVLGKIPSGTNNIFGAQLPFNVFEHNSDFNFGGILFNGSVKFKTLCYPKLPIFIHPSNPAVVLGSKRKYSSPDTSFLMLSTNFGNSYDTTANAFLTDVKNFIDISICKSIPNVMYAIAAENILYGNTKPYSKIIWKSNNSGISWQDITDTITNNGVLRDQLQWFHNATGIVVDPDDPNTVFIYYSSFGNLEDSARVIMSTNGGATFSDISIGLPAFPVTDLVCVPGEADEMFLANDINVYYTNKNNNFVWTVYDNGLPAGMMRDLEYHYKDRKLFVATTGRGIWETELPCDSISSTPTTISGSVLWESDRSPYGHIIIPANCTLTIKNCQIRMRDNRFISVERGGLLIVDRATLTSCSNTTRWRGIMVWGDPATQVQSYAPYGNFGKVVLMNQSMIENAHEGVVLCKADYTTFVLDYTTCGGILDASNSTFKNCRRSIAFLKHPAGTYNARIDNCTFMNTKENTALNQFFVTLWGVNRVTFFNCRFINEEANEEYKMGGVYSIDANYNFYNHLSYLPNKTYFKNLSYGIMVQNFVNTNPVNVDDAVFENCARGVYLGNTVNSNILLNDFKIRNYTEFIPYGICVVNNYFGDNYGVFSDGSHFFRIEENKFTTHDTFSVYDPNIGFDRQSGCIVSNNWGASDMVYKNNFSNLLVANKAFGINRDAQLSATAPATYTLGTQGLQFRCNNYDQGDIPFSTTGVLGVVAEWQGVFNPINQIIEPAGNLFNSHSSVSSPGTHIWYTPDWNQLVPYAMITPQQSVNIKYVFDMNNNCIPNINLDNAINIVDVNYPTNKQNDIQSTCPSKLTTGGGGGNGFSLSAITEFKDSIQVSNALLLAGNAAALHAALDTMSPEDAKIEFDAVGPFISDSVLLHLIDVAYINPAPEWWQILKSNAPMRDDLFELCHELDMDEFDWWELQMIQKKNWSHREMLIAKIGWYRDSIQYQIRDALSYFYPLIPIEEVYLDTLDSYLSIYQTEQTLLDRIDLHLASRNPDFAIQLLDTLADFNALYLPYATLLGEVISVYNEPGGVFDLPEELLDSIESYVSGRKLRFERFNTILVANGLLSHCEDIPALGLPSGGAERESHVLPDESLRRSYEVGLNVFPNPSMSEVRIYYKNRKSQAAELKIFDLAGKEVYNIPNFQTNREFIIPDGILAPGGYIIKAISEMGIQRTSKLIKL
jgi:hypothetical protein